VSTNQPFSKENGAAYQKKGLEAKREKKRKMEEFIVGGRLRKSLELLDRMMEGEKVTKEQIKAIELIRDFLPYEKPKLASVDQNAKITGELTIGWK
jgi:hypothetical protein